MIELNSMSVLHIIPVKRISVQNRHTQMSKSKDNNGNSNTYALQKNKVVISQGRTASDTLTFSKRGDGQYFDAGLSEQITNPFYTKKDDIISHIAEIRNLHGLSDNWLRSLEGICKQSEISKQTYLEIKFGLEPNDLTERVPKRKNGKLVDTEDQTILSRFRYSFYDRTNILKDDTLKGALAIQLVKNHRRIALNKSVANSSQHFYYIDEKEETKFLRTQKRNHSVLRASAKLFEIIENTSSSSDLSNNVLYKIASQCKYKSGQVVVKGKPTPIAIDREINTYIQKNVPDQLHNSEYFLSVVKTMENNPALFNVNFLVQQAINCKVVYYSNGYLLWRDFKDKEGWYRHDSKELFAAFILDHLNKYDPEQPEQINAFNELNKLVGEHPLGVNLDI